MPLVCDVHSESRETIVPDDEVASLRPATARDAATIGVSDDRDEFVVGGDLNEVRCRPQLALW